MKLDPKHIEWSRDLFAKMAEDGGTWTVPRSGLVFRRQGDQLFLNERMPWEPNDVQISRTELIKRQDDDLYLIGLYFKAAGVEVQWGSPVSPPRRSRSQLSLKGHNTLLFGSQRVKK